jgi:uncharacterized phage infection (PIP) family protein YhgE
MILKYNSFIAEKIDVTQTDTTGLVSKKNYINEMEVHIKEFPSKKVQLERIYTNYTDDQNLLQLLKNSGFIDRTISNPRKIEFSNPLFTIYYRACEKMRQLNALQKSIDDTKTTVSEKEKTLQSDNTQSNLQEDITQLNDQLKEKLRQLDTYKSDIKDIQEQTKKKLSQLSTELNQAIKDTRTSIQER